MEECDDIPWSQQVDEASYENLSSATDTKGLCASIQFQNPPFVRAEINTTERQKKAQSNDPDNKRFKMYCNEEFHRSKKKGNESDTSKDGFNDFQSLPAQSSKDVVAYVLDGGNEEHILKNYSINVSTANNFNLTKKKITWASIASQPAKPNKRSSNTLLKKKGPGMPPPPMIPGKHNMEMNSWEYESSIGSTETCETPPLFIPKIERSTYNEEDTVSKNLKSSSLEQHTSFIHKHTNFYSNNAIKNIKSSYKANDNSRRNIQKHNDEHNKNRRAASSNCIMSYKKDIHHEEENDSNVCKSSNLILVNKSQPSDLVDSSHKVLKKLKDRNNYNPSNMDLQIATLSRFFVIKSYSEDDIHRSIKYEIWCSTDHGNKRLDEAFKERTKEKGNVMLFFSVNGSGHFCGMAQMMTPVDYNSTSSVWSQDKWKGKFKVKWIYVKDVPNSQLRHIRLENNDNKSVTNSRDTQEVPNGKGIQVLKVLHSYKHQTSIFDDFYHYEKKQEEAVLKKPTQFDNFLQSSPSLNCYHNGIKEENDNRILENLKDRPISHRGGFHNILGNRRHDRTLEIQLNKNEKVKWKLYENQDHENNETKTQNHQSYKPTCLEDCNSSNFEHNFKDIILHMNNFNCNENEILRANANAKLS